eukprot:14423375-Ditylum_brightwellii.AAC.1
MERLSSTGINLYLNVGNGGVQNCLLQWNMRRVVKTGALFRHVIKSTPRKSIMKQQQATDILEDLRAESIAS